MKWLPKINTLFKQKFPYFGILGFLFAVIAFIVPQFTFKNLEDEDYSPLNHFISELGWIGISKQDIFFNLSLMVAGFFLTIFNYGLTAQFDGFWARSTLFFGILASLGCSLVGFFPAKTELVQMLFHLSAATIFFVNAGLSLLSALFMILFSKNQILSKPFFMLILLTLCPFASLLAVDYNTVLPHLDILNIKIINRPDIWLAPIVEWAIVLSVLIYVLSTSLYFLIFQRYVHN